MDKEKLLEAYESVLLNEATEEDQVSKALEKIFGVKVAKVEVRRKIDIQWRGGIIDQDSPEFFDKIDAFEAVVAKKLKKQGIRTFVNWNLTNLEIKEI